MATFSVNDQVRRVTAVGNNSLLDFNFSFQVNNTSDIKVYLGSTLKQETTDYSIVTSTGAAGLNADGTGTVRFVGAPTSSDTVVILSDVPVSRASIYSSGGNVTASALEGDFDTITMQIGDQEQSMIRLLSSMAENSRSLDGSADSNSAKRDTTAQKSSGTIRIFEGIERVRASEDATVSNVRSRVDIRDLVDPRSEQHAQLMEI